MSLRAVVIGGVLVVVGGWLSLADDSLPPPKTVTAKPPAGPLGETIALGRDVVEQTSTHPLSRDFVGNDLNCTSCHLQNGTHPRAGSFLEIATAYPAWSPREQRVITLEDRVLNCFMRSCNGTRPPLGSRVSVAITTYITWLSQGRPMQMNPSGPLGPRAAPPLSLPAEAASLDNGRKLYLSKCAECHSGDGAGTDDGPPVWGPRSFNEGAGLANPLKLGAWLRVAMPLDDPHLTEQEALDIAAFVDSRPRPAFRLQDHLPSAERLGEYNAKEATIADQP